MAPETRPAQAGALCPYCRQPLSAVGWTVNSEVGLVVFFHNEPGCMVVLNCQMIPIEPKRIQLPNGPRLMGLS